jgi:hypothetical protein
MYPYLVLSVGPHPSSVLSAGQLAFMVAVPVLLLAVWLTLVFAADRETPAPQSCRNDAKSRCSHARRIRSASSQNARPPDVLPGTGRDIGNAHRCYRPFWW